MNYLKTNIREWDWVIHQRYGEIECHQLYVDESGERAVCRCTVDGRFQLIDFSVDSLKKSDKLQTHNFINDSRVEYYKELAKYMDYMAGYK
jgi:trimethylamine:corrinoid methyltransferase-like protein